MLLGFSIYTANAFKEQCACFQTCLWLKLPYSVFLCCDINNDLSLIYYKMFYEVHKSKERSVFF